MKRYWSLAVLAVVSVGVFVWLCQDKTPGLFIQGSRLEVVGHYRGLEGPRWWTVERHSNRSIITSASREERNFPTVASVVDLKDGRGQVFEYYVRDIRQTVNPETVMIELRSVR